MKVDLEPIGNCAGVHAIGLGRDVTAKVQDRMWLEITDCNRGETVILNAAQLRNLEVFLVKCGWKSP